MAHYRYTFLSLRDEQVIEEINLEGVYCQRILNSPGQFNATVPLDQTGKRNQDLVAATVPGKTWVVVEREDVPVWWGINWSRTYQSQAKLMELWSWGFEAFPQRQIMLSDFTRTAQNQLHTFADLWSDMQASKTGRNMNVNVPTSFPPSVIKDVNILATDAKYYGDIMTALADSSDGFDWTIQCYKYNNLYRKDLVMGYPQLGIGTNADYLTFSYPGSILNYYETESMTNAGTHIYGYGAGEGSQQITARVEYNDLVDLQGWPRWDIEVSLKDIDDQFMLNALTLQEGIKRKVPMNHYTVTVKGDLDPIMGSFGLGDSCRLSLKDPKHPDGYEIITRIIGFELHPPSSGSVEQLQLILPGDDVGGQIPVAAQ